MRPRTAALLRSVTFMLAPLFYHALPASAQVTADIPTENPVDAALERLADRGLLSNDLRAFRTVTLAGLEQRTDDAAANAGEDDPDVKLLRRYTERNRHWGFDFSAGFWGTTSKSAPVPEISASINPLLEHAEGRWSDGGVAGWMEPRLFADWGGWGAVDLAALFPLQWSNEGAGGETRPVVRRAALKLGRGGFEIGMGRFPVRWGHGFSGSFIFGDSQVPFDGVQIRNAIPVRLPWIFSYLGPVQFSAIVAGLDGEQVFPHGYVVGERIGLKPANWLELGYAQTVILGGKGSPDISFWEGFTEVLGRRAGDIYGQNLSNRNFLIDARVSIPPFYNLALYGELFLEDCCAHYLRDVSNLVGVALPDLGPGGLSVDFEWVRTTEITFRNGAYTSGFESHGHLLGHTIGPDAMGYYVRARQPWSDRLDLEARFALERRGRNGKNQRSSSITSAVPDFEKPETRYRLTFQPTYHPRPDFFVVGETGYEFAQDYRFHAGDTKHNFLGSIRVGMEL